MDYAEGWSTVRRRAAIKEVGHASVEQIYGLDVHKATIAVSIADIDGGTVRYFGEIENTPEAIEKLVTQLSKGRAEAILLL